jgi:hypothetical protein
MIGILEDEDDEHEDDSSNSEFRFKRPNSSGFAARALAIGNERPAAKTKQRLAKAKICAEG